MTKLWLATITEGKPLMADYTRANFNDWCKLNNGKQVEIKPRGKKVSEDLRNFYFGAYIPLLRSTCDKWKYLDSQQLHEVTKREFFYFEAWSVKNQRMERYGRSIMSDSDWNNTEKAMGFLDVLNQYLIDCGITPPDPSDWKRWRDSAPLKDE